MVIVDLTFIFDVVDVFEGEGPSRLKHGCSSVGLWLIFWSWGLISFWIGVFVSVRSLIWISEEVVGESHRLRDLEESVQGDGGAAHANEEGVEGGALLLDSDIKVNGEGGFLDS